MYGSDSKQDESNASFRTAGRESGRVGHLIEDRVLWGAGYCPLQELNARNGKMGGGHAASLQPECVASMCGRQFHAMSGVNSYAVFVWHLGPLSTSFLGRIKIVNRPRKHSEWLLYHDK